MFKNMHQPHKEITVSHISWNNEIFLFYFSGPNFDGDMSKEKYFSNKRETALWSHDKWQSMIPYVGPQ